MTNTSKRERAIEARILFRPVLDGRPSDDPGLNALVCIAQIRACQVLAVEIYVVQIELVAWSRFLPRGGARTVKAVSTSTVNPVGSVPGDGLSWAWRRT